MAEVAPTPLLERNSINVAKIFVDTNILVYAHDRDAGKKHESAKRILKKLWENQNAVISLQILQEFFTTLTKKINPSLSAKHARELVEVYSAWEVFLLQPINLLEAIDLQMKYKFSFWDSLVIRTAQLAECSFILSEDLQHKQKIEKIRLHNPFLEDEDFPIY